MVWTTLCPQRHCISNTICYILVFYLYKFHLSSPYKCNTLCPISCVRPLPQTLLPKYPHVLLNICISFVLLLLQFGQYHSNSSLSNISPLYPHLKHISDFVFISAY